MTGRTWDEMPTVKRVELATAWPSGTVASYAQAVMPETSWGAMLGEGERDASAEEIAAIEAAYGPLTGPRSSVHPE